jgi:hypothetical protein
MGPWKTDQINQARNVPFPLVLKFLGAYNKLDREYRPFERGRNSIRVHVNYEGRDFRFVITGEKWVDELMPATHPKRGGGGTIDFVSHITGFKLVNAVKVCLDAQSLADGEAI